MGKFVSKIIILVLMYAAMAFFASAQFLPEELALFANPSSPSPGETFGVEAATPTFDKNASFFQWTVNGVSRPDLSGMGKNTIELTAGGVGSLIRIGVTASHPREGMRSASLAVRVSDLALIWSAETYVPRWYKGKALPVQDSVVRIVAVPHIIMDGAVIDPGNLIYTWSLDDEERALTGAGKRVFRVRFSNFPRDTHRISVTVEDRLKRIRKEKFILLEAGRGPRLGVYELSPLGGVEPRRDVSLLFPVRGETLDLIAEPFFFTVNSKRGLAFDWRVAGSAVRGSPENPFILTLNLLGQPRGFIEILARAQDAASIFLPAASKTLNLFIP